MKRLVEIILAAGIGVCIGFICWNFYDGYKSGLKSSNPSTWRALSYPVYLTNGTYTVSYYGKWHTNNENLVEKWCAYGYGQGVTNGVVAAFSNCNHLLIRVASGDKLTREDVNSAIFGSISNAMIKNKYEYFDSRAFNDSK